ncbi:SdiA-regulated domain-containing protein [Gramella sp. MAR_2010_147]|uniref:SdiA-regulated domain-containing protein n=1 Tax=Gramella sp. MAR_2010_147 TaxID=1250205 RepID=UPI00087D4BC7|nr:SdiA-regulated domain-containing protein [Gramella sp. MAR_2010_147]SDR80814.1 SdiA-regulated [Gramella sp. MAR_2010_147]
MNKWAIGIIAFTLILAGIVYAIYEKNDYDFDDATKSYEILNKWELPQELDEVSGIYWMGDNKMACVQDEDGIIFIYDLSSSKIIKEYKFADAGDYEALGFQDGEFWIAESNGKLFNVKSLDGVEDQAEIVELEFEYRNNIEGLAASRDGNLWLSVKDRNLDNSSGYKGIYSFNPKTKRLAKEPVLKIMYNDPKFDVLKTDNPRKLIRPSDLSFSPVTNDLYVLDAEFQKVLILNRNGSIKDLHLLDPAEFTQPEGICFSPSGRIFISNESLGGPANIIEIKIN